MSSGGGTGTREEAAAQAVVVSCTPGETPVILGADLRPGQHLAVLGADGHGKREVEIEAIRHCRLFCDEWEQASAGGELAFPVAAGGVRRSDVTELGQVLRGSAPGAPRPAEVTLFDSTGLAIQDLGIVSAVYRAWKAGGIEAPSVEVRAVSSSSAMDARRLRSSAGGPARARPGRGPDPDRQVRYLPRPRPGADRAQSRRASGRRRRRRADDRGPARRRRCRRRPAR